MLDEAHAILGVGPAAGAQEIETAYWARARELADQRNEGPAAAEDLERVNWAYETLSKDRMTRITPPTWKRRPSRVRQLAVAGIVAAVLAGGAYAGAGHRATIADGATRGIEEAHHGWDGAVEWLQALDAEPTPEPSDATAR